VSANSRINCSNFNVTILIVAANPRVVPQDPGWGWSEEKAAGQGIGTSGAHHRSFANVRYAALGLEYLLVAVIAGTQHHPVLAEGDRLIIVICRNVSDAENRHCRPVIMDTPATCIATACISTTCISWARYCACFFRNRERQ